MNIYQIFTRLYGNETSTNIPHGTLQENGSSKMNNYTDHVLKHLRNYGFTHLWYTGLLEHATQTDYRHMGIAADHPSVVKGKAGSPYAIKDYYDIDPDLAQNVEQRMQEFEDLVERTHRAGLKVIIDFVPNHVARQYHSDAAPSGVKDLGEDDQTEKHFSPTNNFYYHPGEALCLDQIGTENLASSPYEEMPARSTGNNQFSAHPHRNDWYETIKLNYGVDYCGGAVEYFWPLPNTWTKMTEILLFWAAKKVDAFRCDMAEMVPVAFWHYAIAEVKKQYPQVQFIAEVYDPSQYRRYIHEGGFDYLYDKVGMYDTLRNICTQGYSTHDITRAWQAVDDIGEHMLNFLENHDEQRIASEFFCADPQKALPAFAVQAFRTSAPLMLYAGQEIGEAGMDSEGFSGRDGRTTIFDYWCPTSLKKLYAIAASPQPTQTQYQLLESNENWLYEQYRTILQLRQREAVLREGRFFDLMYVNLETRGNYNPHRCYAFLRATDEALALVVANFAPQACAYRLHIPQHAFEHLHIAEGTYPALELFTQTEQKLHLSVTELLSLTVPAYGTVVWKLEL